jgi:ribosome production factor 1
VCCTRYGVVDRLHSTIEQQKSSVRERTKQTDIRYKLRIEHHPTTSMGKKTKGKSKSMMGKKPINSAQKVVAKYSQPRHQTGGSGSGSIPRSSKDHTNSSDGDGGRHRTMPTNPSHIGNKLKRSEMYGKYLQEKAQIKQEKRRQRKEEEEDGGEDDDDNDTAMDGTTASTRRTMKNVPKTIDSTREVEVTMVHPEDMEVMGDEADDEFAPYFRMVRPKSRPSLPPIHHHRSNDPTAVASGNDDSDDDDQDDDANDDYDERLDAADDYDDCGSSGSTNSGSDLLTPKVLVTTRPNPSKNLFYFIADLQKLIPSLHYYPRKLYSIQQITTFATHRNFTHLIVLSEKSKVCNGMLISHLGCTTTTAPPPPSVTTESSDTTAPATTYQLVGPTAFFKVSNVVTAQNIPNHGASTSHRPELNLFGFQTRLGVRMGRFLASLFPLQVGPQYHGRQVATFHNQRDYIFVRQHRYIFNAKPARRHDHDSTTGTTTATTKLPPLDTTTAPTAVTGAAANMPVATRLQELGPRFTLKLRWLQDGVVSDDSSGGFSTGTFEFVHKRKEMDTSRRKFHL